MKNNIDSIIKLAWHDKSSFEKIYRLYGVSEKEVILIMRKNLRPSSFKIWRKRVSGRKSKHEKKFKLLDKKINFYEFI
ncbi:TIGR03643 family protein [Alphaproteobacteria bacterium]|nr:TIGR03643 family protein [Alphaproteobacteria bacterium]